MWSNDRFSSIRTTMWSIRSSASTLSSTSISIRPSCDPLAFTFTPASGRTTLGSRPYNTFGGASVPGRCVVDPAAAQHGRDDAHLGKLVRRDRERVAIEDDEVGQVAGGEPAGA